MWRRFAFRRFAGVAICLLFACLQTRAQDSDLDCDSFVKNPDGSWTVMEKAYIPGPNVRVEVGAVFRSGGSFLGDDLAARLDRVCPNAAVSAPATVQAAVPQVPLSKFADASGNIDARRLTCAQLDLTSAGETELLLSWYSGWYNGVAKKRAFNSAQVRYAIRSVVDFCKGNPDRNLAQVMDAVLK